jgi:hypothetical protein
VRQGHAAQVQGESAAMKLSLQQRRVLKLAARDHGLPDAQIYRQGWLTVSWLRSRGLIVWRADYTSGHGYVITSVGREVLREEDGNS